MEAVRGSTRGWTIGLQTKNEANKLASESVKFFRNGRDETPILAGFILSLGAACLTVTLSQILGSFPVLSASAELDLSSFLLMFWFVGIQCVDCFFDLRDRDTVVSQLFAGHHVGQKRTKKRFLRGNKYVFDSNKSRCLWLFGCKLSIFRGPGPSHTTPPSAENINASVMGKWALVILLALALNTSCFLPLPDGNVSSFFQHCPRRPFRRYSKRTCGCSSHS